MTPAPSSDPLPATGLILAGGQGSRLGGQDKGLLILESEPLVLHTARLLHPWVEHLLVSCNRHEEDYRALGIETVADTLPGFAGPLAGIAAALGHVCTPLLLVLPCDMPRLPPAVIPALLNLVRASDVDLCHVWDGERDQPLVMCLRTALLDNLLDYLASGQRSVMGWIARCRATRLDGSQWRESFGNINTAADLARLSNPGAT